MFFPATPLFVEHFRALLYPLILLAMAWLVRRPGSVAGRAHRGPAGAAGRAHTRDGVPRPGVVRNARRVRLDPESGRRRPCAGSRRHSSLRSGRGVFTLVFVVFLWANGALGSFIDYFRIFAAGHELTGGIPITGDGAVFDVAVYLPPVLFLISIWYLISRVRARRPLERDDWVLLPVFFFGVLYYTKFLARADAHVLHSFAVITPLLWYIVMRVLAQADRLWSRRGALGPGCPARGDGGRGRRGHRAVGAEHPDPAGSDAGSLPHQRVGAVADPAPRVHEPRRSHACVRSDGRRCQLGDTRRSRPGIRRSSTSPTRRRSTTSRSGCVRRHASTT